MSTTTILIILCVASMLIAAFRNFKRPSWVVDWMCLGLAFFFSTPLVGVIFK